MTGRATQLAPSCAPTAFDTVNAHHRSACGEASPHPARTGSCGKRPCHPASILTGQGTAAPALLRVFRARVSLPRASDRGTSGTSAWSTNQVTVRPPRCRQPHRSASLSTIPSPRPSSASAPAGRSSGSPGPLRSATSTRTAPAPTVTVTVTVSPGRPELLWRRLLAKSSTREQHGIVPARVPRAEYRAHEQADNPHALHQPGDLHALANRYPSHQFTAFPPPGKTRWGPNGRAGKCTLTSAAIVKPTTRRWRATPSAQPGDLPRILSAKTRPSGQGRNPRENSASRRIPYCQGKCLTMPFQALDRSCVVEEAGRLAYALALESAPYGVGTTIVSAAKSHRSDSRSAYETARAALVQPEPAAGAARPWPSVKQPTVRTDRGNCAHRPS